MKIKDRLTKKDYRIVFIIVLLGLVAYSTFSCTANDHPPLNEHHIIIVDEETYLFSSSLDLSNQDKPMSNGDIYSYTLDGNNVTLTTELTSKEVTYHRGVMDSEGEVIEMIDGSWSKDNISDNHYFRFKY